MKYVFLSALVLAGLAGSSPAADVRYVKQCYVDANGFERCRTVAVVAESATVPTTDAKLSRVAESPSPVVTVSEVVSVRAASWVSAARASGVLFPRVRAIFESVREHRAERVFSRRAFLFGAFVE